jgi:hypothetical protein
MTSATCSDYNEILVECFGDSAFEQWLFKKPQSNLLTEQWSSLSCGENNSFLSIGNVTACTGMSLISLSQCKAYCASNLVPMFINERRRSRVKFGAKIVTSIGVARIRIPFQRSAVYLKLIFKS